MGTGPSHSMQHDRLRDLLPLVGALYAPSLPWGCCVIYAQPLVRRKTVAFHASNARSLRLDIWAPSLAGGCIATQIGYRPGRKVL